MSLVPPVRIALDEGPTRSFFELAARYLVEYRGKIEVALEPLSDEQLWWRPNDGANSIGNLLLHLEGNLSFWLLAGVGGTAYERHRAAEFAARGGSSRDVLLANLGGVVERCRRLLLEADPTSLSERREIQGYDTNVLGAAFHAIEHMSYHTGQILWIAKSLRGTAKPMELYPRHRSE